MTKALILAGGLGTRLRPLTYTRPKPLLPIGNRPHIEHVFDLLERHGISQVALLTSYLAEAFEPVRERARARGMELDVTHETEPLGTGGALRNAIDLIGDETFLAFNGDVVTDADLGHLLGLHHERGAQATMMLTPVDDPSMYGVVTTRSDGAVTDFIEKPPAGQAPTNLINAGVYVMEPAVIDRIPSGRPVSSEHELFPQLVRDGVLYAFGIDAYWNEIGDPRKYLGVNLDVLAGRFQVASVGEIDDRRCLVADDAEISSRAQVSSSCFGSKCRVDDATVRDSVLLPGAVVEDGAEIAGCILGEDARIGAGTKASGETLADGSMLGGNQ